MFLFIITHIGSGSELLCKSLRHHVRIYQHNKSMYKDYRDLLEMRYRYATVFFDCLFYNQQLHWKNLVKNCKFIFLIRNPAQALYYLNKTYAPQKAIDYYFYRLRRLAEMKSWSQSLTVDYNQLAQDETYEKIGKFIGLKTPIKNYFTVDNVEIIRNENLEKRYQYYYSWLKA